MRPIDQKIGKRIAQIRKLSGLSQEAVAQKAGISTDFQSKLERGVTGISIGTLDAISTALGVPITQMLNFTNEEAPQQRNQPEQLIIVEKDADGMTIQRTFRVMEERVEALPTQREVTMLAV